ncbi:hypothetical protein KCU61_g549, partial [Aureobasidium melanogenum]
MHSRRGSYAASLVELDGRRQFGFCHQSQRLAAVGMACSTFWKVCVADSSNYTTSVFRQSRALETGAESHAGAIPSPHTDAGMWSRIIS